MVGTAVVWLETQCESEAFLSASGLILSTWDNNTDCAHLDLS